MRIETLEVTAFGPFRDTQRVDLGALAADGIFLITGRTGAGKSSILDAVCFALYGGVPRYDGNPSRLRSDHADPAVATRVELVFSVGPDTYRVTREPDQDRAKARGEGTRRVPQKATLERRDPDGWMGLAARPTDVATLLGPVLGLSRDQFLQVILLAQGRFSEFLRATSEDRVVLLRALFGTARFEAVEKAVQDRARAARDAVGDAADRLAERAERLAALAGVEPPAEPAAAWARSIAERLRVRADEAQREAERAAERLTDADGRAADAVATAALQRRRDTARAAEAALLAEAPAIAVLRGEAADAERASRVADVLGGADRARAGLVTAREGLATAEAGAGDLPDDLPAAIDETTKQAGTLEDALRVEASLPGLRARRDRADEAVEEAQAALRRLEAEDAEVPARREAVQHRLRAASVADAAEPGAAQAVAEARRVAEAAVRIVALGAELDRARAAELAARHDQAAAVEAARSLATARLAASAGVLAAGLEDDVPCPVCGSLEHPAPAAPTEGVDDEAVDAADAATEQAREAFGRAKDRATGIASDLAAAAATAGGLDPASASAALASAQDLLDGIRSAAADLPAAEAAARALADDETTLDARSADARAALSAAAADRQAAGIALTDAEERVAAARGAFASVTERAAAAAGRLAALRAVRDARAEGTAATAALAAAERVLAERLADEGFTDEAAARAAQRSPGRRAELADRVGRHDAALGAARAVLEEPAIAAAPTEPADTEGAEQVKADALAARLAAATAATEAGRDARDAETVAGEIAADEAGVADARERLAVLGPLAATLHGDDPNTHRMRLETYVLAARLEQIVDAANGRLSAMTGERFTLQHSDAQAARGAQSGLGLEVLDAHTGRARTPASLSGGETFLASLALALGLAEVVAEEAGGVRLDTLFVDEGFGSLDRETLDTAMATLDSLRAGGRVVGLISHVEAMQEDIPAGLHVVRLPDGSSAVRVRDASMAG